MSIHKLSILIPAYNEENTIHLILERVKEVELPKGIVKEIVIVNDCSKDKTIEKVEAYIAQNTEMDIRLFHKRTIKEKARQSTGRLKNVQAII